MHFTNASDNDFKLEVVITSLIEQGCDPELIQILRDGIDRRAVSKDIEQVYQKFNDDDLKPYTHIHVNREVIGGAAAAFSPKMGGNIIFGDDLPRAAGQKMGIDTEVECDPVTGHGIKRSESGLLEVLEQERDSLPPSGMVKIYADKS